MRIPKSQLVGILLVFAMLAAACGDSTSDTTAAAGTTAPATTAPGTDVPAETLRIAFFASSSQNSYNQAVYEGVQQAAAEDGNVETEIFDSEFNAELQFNQIQDVITSGRFDGYVIVPNDPVGIAPAAEEALADGPTATALFPIGPDLDTLEGQLNGDIITAAGLVRPAATAAAELVVDYCENIDPCRVVIIIGLPEFPFDVARLEAFNEVLGAHDNIEIVAQGVGQYSQDVSLTAMQDILQANPEFEVLLSNADQHVTGALIALEEAGLDIPSMWISGGGASAVAIEGIRAGIWDASTSNFPVTEGLIAARNVIASLRGGTVEYVNDINVNNPLGVPVVTVDILDANPDFVAEWAG